MKVLQFAGGHERTNLQYEVWPVERYEKDQTILELLRARFTGRGSAVIYCATRRHSENLAEFLQNNGFTAEAFHAGLDPSLKKRIQTSFIDGATPIICATNAFGMGIDKEESVWSFMPIFPAPWRTTCRRQDAPAVIVMSRSVY